MAVHHSDDLTEKAHSRFALEKQELREQYERQLKAKEVSSPILSSTQIAQEFYSTVKSENFIIKKL